MNSFFRKLFLSSAYFTIALRPRSAQSILLEPYFSPTFVRTADAAHWCADPMLAEENGRTWLFYEAVEQNLGHIEVAEVLDDCSLGVPKVVLKDDCHYSYPFVFRWNDRWYMIPESSASGEVRLYQAERFPDQWTLREILLRERAVDTTVYEQDGRLYLLTFLTEKSSERVMPRAYELSLREDGSALKPLDWTVFDTLQVRGAGPVLEEDDRFYRPAQVNQDQRYGDAIKIYRLTGGEAGYSEEPFSVLSTPRGSVCGQYVDGAHTYCRSSRFEAIDLRCRTVDLWKLPRRLLRHLKR